MRNSTILLLGALLAYGCATYQAEHGGATPATATAQARRSELGRAELWAAHCTRCHNLRSRTEYSAAQWAVIVNHMRTVADLPGQDYRQLLGFLSDWVPAPRADSAHPKVVVKGAPDTSRTNNRKAPR